VAHPRVGARERAVLEDGVGEEVGGRHRHDEAVFVQGAPEAGDDAVALRGGGAVGHQVVVVEVDAVGAELGELGDRVRRVEGRPGGFAERVAAGFETVQRPKVKRSAGVGA
jgi:hypothetical protein